MRPRSSYRAASWIRFKYRVLVCLGVGLVLSCCVPLRLDAADVASSQVSRPARPAKLVELTGKIDKIIQPLIKSKRSVGMVVGVIRGRERLVLGYGKATVGSDRRPDGDTVFEIGSITKVFTTLLLADMTRAGLVKLDDPIGKFLPESVKAPAYGEQQITLFDLATQTSGLPRVPNNMPFSDLENPYADYTVEQLYKFLSNCRVQFKPGANYLYSNLGMGLLGHLLTLAEKKDFEQLVIDRICQLLGMDDTRITLSPQLQSRLAKGHSSSTFPLPPWRIVKVVKNWDIPTLAGAGALRSTANDMLKFLSGNLGLTKTTLLPAMEITHISRRKIVEELSVAMAWHMIDPDDMEKRIVWHNGGTGGYHSFLGFNKKHQAGVIVLSNSNYDIDLQAIKILQLVIKPLLPSPAQ